MPVSFLLLLIGGFGRIGFDSHSPFVVKPQWGNKNGEFAMRITFIFQGLRVSNYWVRISIVLFLLAVCYCLIQLNFDLNILGESIPIGKIFPLPL